MADNTTLNSGSGGDTLATDDIGGVKYPRSKIVLGADGSNDGDVSSANPLPVTGTLTAVTSITNTVTVDGSGSTQPVSGTVTANLGATDNAVLDAIAASLVDIETNTDSGAVVGGGLEATALRVTIASDSTGVVSVDDGGSSLTVDGTVAATQSGTWTVDLGATENAVLDTIATPVATISSTPLQRVAIFDASDTQITSFGGGTQYATDAALGSTPTGTMAMAARDDALSTLTPVEGDAVHLRCDANGALWVIPSGTVTVDGSGVTQPISASSLPLPSGAATAANQSTGNSSLSTIAGAVSGSEMQVDIVGSLPTGSATIGSINTVFTCSTLTGSGVAHDSADSGNPHKIGAKATTSLAGLTLVANADRTDLRAGTDGALIVRNGYSLEDIVSEVDTNTDGASTAFASGLAAPGAGIRLYITRVTIANSSSSFCTVDLRDGSAGSVLWTVPVPAEGGATLSFDPPLKLTANTALAYDASAATTTLSISASGFKSKV